MKKPEEELVENGKAADPNNLSHWRVKARWCLQGHLDPDLFKKGSSGQPQSPTLSQIRTVLYQLMATFRWRLQLGDVKGAFLEAGPLAKCYRPLYARLSAGGIPGTDEDCLIEVLGNALGARADDTATGGSGSKYTKALEYLRQRCPYRKWRMDAGEFCGAHYRPIIHVH